MTLGLALIVHALRMLVHQPGTTLRVILPGLLLVLGSTLAAQILVPETLAALVSNDPQAIMQLETMSVLLLLLFGLGGLLGYVLMAILWHRHVLLNGPERETETLPGTKVIARYSWAALVVALVQLLAGVPILFGLGLLASPAGVGAEPGQGAGILFSILGGIVFVWVAMRVSIVLPAAAMGQHMRIKRSWQASAPLSGATLAIAVLLSLLNFTISLIASLIVPEPGTFALLVETCVFLIEGLVFVSVMTTLYGHLIEGRPLG